LGATVNCIFWCSSDVGVGY